MRAEGKHLKTFQSETLDDYIPYVDTTKAEWSSQESQVQRDENLQPDAKLSFDPTSLRARYDIERDKRLAANPAGLDQYISVDNQDASFRKYLDDPYIEERITRDPIHEESEVLIIGGGFGGQLVTVRLIEQGVTNIKILEKGGDFGGTWYISLRLPKVESRTDRNSGIGTDILVPNVT